MSGALGGQLLTLVVLVVEVSSQTPGTYEEYEIESRPPLRRTTPELEQRRPELSALNYNDDPYGDYRRQREERAYRREEEERGYRREGENRRHRDRDKKRQDSRDYRKPRYGGDSDSRDYRSPRDGESRDSRFDSRSRKSYLSIFESKPFEEMMEETFERYKHQMQEKINAEYERERKEFLAKKKEGKMRDDNFIAKQLFGNNKEYMAPNAPAKKSFSRVPHVKFEKQYGKHYRQHKPVDTNHETMKELVFELYSHGLIKSSKIYDVMLKIDRKHYLMKTNDSYFPYKDQIQYLPMGVVINAPHEHARALELLRDHLRPGAQVLDIGAGAGYLTACMADMVGPRGQVTAVELIPEVLQFTQYNVQQGNPELLPRIKFELSDGRASFGENGPYDVIHVGAAYSKHPEIFLLHLKPGGRLVIPIGETRQQLLNIYDKFANETVEKQSWGLVQFQYLKSMSQQLRIMELPKAKPLSVALKYYIEKMMDDRLADMSDSISTTESIKRLRGEKKSFRKAKKKKFYNLAYEQKKHKLDENAE